MSAPIDAEILAQHAEALIDELEALENTRAPLFAVYGPGGTWEAERKAMLCACAIDIRAEVGDRKVTEAWIDQNAHDHVKYRSRIELAEEERTQMALLDAQIAAKERRYELAKSRMYALGRMAGLV